MDYIVCGWYTPDYKHWFDKLELSLIEHNAPYDFLAVPKIEGGWERNTCRKAGFALQFMDRHPGKTIILLDVDCVVTGNLSKLTDLPCDIALDFHIQRKRRRINLVPATGHVILQPTRKTRELMEAWARISAKDEFGLNDQETLTFALGDVHDLQLLRLDKTARGTVLHSSAALTSGIRKVNGRDRFWNKVKETLYPLYSAWNHRRWLEEDSMEQSLRAERNQR